MKRVTGIGGIFFKSENPEKLYQWYQKHLGIESAADGSGVGFPWRDADGKQKNGRTVWAIFPSQTKYLDPSRSSFMINFRVENLDALLEALRKEGVEVDPHREDYDYGRFAWIMDPEGNRIELWEPLNEG
ncbi:MAG TPA: VOC family protein [Candidatus Limnocylindria bacterium]|nr:VOC family protein [Candidatus Limnocylindria bacterium]